MSTDAEPEGVREDAPVADIAGEGAPPRASGAPKSKKKSERPVSRLSMGEALHRFHGRMVTLGRSQEWTRIYKEISAEHPEYHAFVLRKLTAKRMGFKGIREESLLYDQVLLKQIGKSMTDKRTDDIRSQQLLEDFDATVSTLPIAADYEAEMNWIATHPLINRQDRHPTRTNIVLTGLDIAGSPNGKPPSQRAARRLQHYVNHPKDIWKRVDDYHQKAAPKKVEKKDAAEDVRAADPGLEEAMRLLGEVGGE